jgi:hypothetical protein
MLVRNLGKKTFLKVVRMLLVTCVSSLDLLLELLWVPQCKAAFHVECFTAFHYKDALKGSIKALIDMLNASEIARKNWKEKSKYVGSIDSLTLPTKPIQRPRKNRSNSNDSNDNSSGDTSSTVL